MIIHIQAASTYVDERILLRISQGSLENRPKAPRKILHALAQWVKGTTDLTTGLTTDLTTGLTTGFDNRFDSNSSATVLAANTSLNVNSGLLAKFRARFYTLWLSGSREQQV